MFLITITDWKSKLGVLLRLVIFLVLIGLVLPQLLNFISGEITGLKNGPEGGEPPAMRVENGQQRPSSANLLQKLHDYYLGKKLR